MLPLESQHSCAAITQLISEDKGGGNFPGPHRLPQLWHHSFLLNASAFHTQRTLAGPWLDCLRRGPHSVKLRAYNVFFHMPKIKCVFCSALGGALEAILRPPPKMVPSRVPTLNSALFLYSISKASYCYLANWIIKLSIFEFKKTYYNPSKQKGFFHGNYLSSTLSWLEFT